MIKDSAMLPQENEAGIKFLTGNNFLEFKRARRMRLGKRRTVHLKKTYNRVNGQIG
jgi:hypothetical protein